MIQTDKIGRATFHHIAPQRVTRLTNREIRWLKHIERHGPQSSHYLYELTKDTHRCKDTALRQMQKLRAGGFLNLPRQQRATKYANFNASIYDLTPKAQEYLFDNAIAETTITPSGHWVHGYMTSCITSSIDIAASRDNVRYIPAHEILAIKGAPLAILIEGQKLIPDQIFALDYGGSFRAFALEADRGTEPKTTTAKRKNYANSIDQYRKLIEHQVYKSHYGLKAPLLILWVFSCQSNEVKFLEMVAKIGGKISRMVLTQSFQNQVPRGLIDDPFKKLFNGKWNRAADKPVGIAKPKWL